jgi:glutathione S-transferase
MITLYTKPHCPYCTRVITANETIGVDFTIVDVAADPEQREKLITLGGKPQVPFLHDEEKGVMMYESSDIVIYLANTYGDGISVTLPDSPNICPIE